MTAEAGTGSKPTPDPGRPAAGPLAALPEQPQHGPRQRHGWLTLTSFQWLEGQPAAVELAPGLWSTDGTTAFLTAAAADGLTLVETGEPVDGTISAVLADEESLMWVQYGGDDGRQVVVELAMRADKYAIRTRDSQSPVFTEFDGVPTFDYRPDLVVEARFAPYPEPVDVPIGTANPLVDGVHRSVGELVFRLPGKDHEFHLQAEEEKLGALTVTFHDETNGEITDEWRKVSTARPRHRKRPWSWTSTVPSITPAPSPRTAPAPCR